jgi:purine-binding chemotaxis protein CheW
LDYQECTPITDVYTGVTMKQYCTFTIEDELFAIDVDAIQEVINLPMFAEIPRAKEFITGIFSLRGQIITNICINTLFSMKNKTICQHCIVLKMEPDPMSLNVNEVLDILDVSPERIEPCPEMISDNIKNYLEGVIKVDNKIITILDVKKFIS